MAICWTICSLLFVSRITTILSATNTKSRLVDDYNEKIFKAEQNLINELIDYYDNEDYEDNNDNNNDDYYDNEDIEDNNDNDNDDDDYYDSLNELSMKDITDDIMYYYNQLLSYSDLDSDLDSDQPPEYQPHPMVSALHQRLRQHLQDKYIKPRLQQLGQELRESEQQRREQPLRERELPERQPEYQPHPIMRRGEEMINNMEHQFQKYEGYTCRSTNGRKGQHVMRGTAEQCKARCKELGPRKCVGFVRVNRGKPRQVGKCVFRTGELYKPFPNKVKDRDCYVPDWSHPRRKYHHRHHKGFFGKAWKAVKKSPITRQLEHEGKKALGQALQKAPSMLMAA